MVKIRLRPRKLARLCLATAIAWLVSVLVVGALALQALMDASPRVGVMLYPVYLGVWVAVVLIGWSVLSKAFSVWFEVLSADRAVTDFSRQSFVIHPVAPALVIASTAFVITSGSFLLPREIEIYSRSVISIETDHTRIPAGSIADVYSIGTSAAAYKVL